MFLLCLLRLGESRMHIPRHHGMRYPPELNRFRPSCHMYHKDHVEPLQFGPVQGNKETRTVYTPDLDSLSGLIAAKYPLIKLDQLKSGRSEESRITNVDRRVTLEIQIAVATREGDKYKVVFQKGEGYSNYVAQDRHESIRKCWSYTTRTRDEYTNRNLTGTELNQIVDAIKSKISMTI